MTGFVALTMNDWFSNLIHLNDGNMIVGEINYLSKNKEKFKSLNIGEPFYFLVKNKKGVKGERKLLGKATYLRSEFLSIDEAWDKFRNNNGYMTLGDFKLAAQNYYGDDLNDISFIILRDIVFFKHPVFLSNLDISFNSNNVLGKSINDKLIAKIEKYVSIDRESALAEEFLRTINYDITFPEGRTAYVKHAERERNKELVNNVKHHFYKEHGSIYCEACGFDFNKHYGALGEGFIECHLTKPISQIENHEKTNLEDVILLCANCHSMVHRESPWLEIDELIRIINIMKNKI